MSGGTSGRRRPSLRMVAAGILLVALVLGGVVSFYAASSPDGLTKVSQDQGFADSETDHGTGDGPFAGYDAGFVSGDRLRVGVAGVVGVAVVLGLTAGLTRMVRRRDEDVDEAEDGVDRADRSPDPLRR